MLNPNKADGFLVLTHALREDEAMRNKRSEFGNRRHDCGMPKVPFKDSHGATIKECRRKIPDRRINNIQVEWLDVERIDITQ